jgi:hypothetical protein
LLTPKTVALDPSLNGASMPPLPETAPGSAMSSDPVTTLPPLCVPLMVPMSALALLPSFTRCMSPEIDVVIVSVYAPGAVAVKSI